MKKVIIIVAAVLIVVGGVLFTVSLARSGFNFSKLSSVETETNTYTAEGDFQKISIRTSLSDIVLKKAEDGKLSVLCTETEKTRHTVSVEDGTLTIAQTDARAWTDHLVLFSRALSVTVFLPGEVYDSLTVRCGTGDIVVPESFCFGDVDISSTTGDVRFSSSVSGKLKIETTTGSVVTNNLAAGEMELSVSTGNIEASSVICSGNVSLRVGTGKARLTDLLCLNILSSGSTGEITLKNVNAFQTIDIERSTGDIRFDGADAKEINAKTTTGDVTGSLFTFKQFIANSTTGSVNVPLSQGSDPCRLSTTTGEINIIVADPVDASPFIVLPYWYTELASATLDVDGNGVPENLTLSYGPTSGNFSLAVSASENGKRKYEGWFIVGENGPDPNSMAEIGFSEIDGTVCITGYNLNKKTGKRTDFSIPLVFENGKVMPRRAS